MGLDGDISFGITAVHLTAVFIQIAGHCCAAYPSIDVLASHYFLSDGLRIDSAKRANNLHLLITNALSFQ